MIARMRNRAALRRARERQMHRAHLILVVSSLALMTSARSTIVEMEARAEIVTRTIRAIDARLAR